MSQQKDKIVDAAFELFLKYGIRSVSMDDIARHLGISKKTLYQYITNKRELVEYAMTKSIREEKEVIEGIFAKEHNAVEEMVAIAHFVYHQLSLIDKRMIYDLTKYYPDVMCKLDDFHNQFIFDGIKENLQKGISEGLYRDDMDIDIIARLYMVKAQSIIHDDFFSRIQAALWDIYLEHFRYHAYGITTEAGRSHFDNHIDQLKQLPHGKL